MSSATKDLIFIRNAAETYTALEAHLSVTILVICIIIGVPGNIVLVRMFVKRLRTAFKQSRGTPAFNLTMAALAAADLAVLLINVPIYIAYIYRQVQTEVVCNGTVFLANVFLISSHFILTVAVPMDRFNAVRNRSRKFQWRCSIGVLTVIALISVGYSTPFLWLAKVYNISYTDGGIHKYGVDKAPNMPSRPTGTSSENVQLSSLVSDVAWKLNNTDNLYGNSSTGNVSEATFVVESFDIIGINISRTNARGSSMSEGLPFVHLCGLRSDVSYTYFVGIVVAGSIGFLVMFVLYGAIGYEIWSVKRRLHTNSNESPLKTSASLHTSLPTFEASTHQASSGNNNTNDSMQLSCNSGQNNLSERQKVSRRRVYLTREIKLVAMMFSVSLIYVFAYTPSILVHLSKISNVPLLRYSYVINNMITFLVYAFMSPSMRREMIMQLPVFCQKLLMSCDRKNMPRCNVKLRN